MAILFDDASSQYLDTTYTLGVPCSMAAWFYSDDAANGQTIMSIGNSAAASQFLRLTAQGNVSGDPIRASMVHGGFGGINVTADSSTGYSVNTWHHACTTVDFGGTTTTVNAYIDGGSKGTAADTSTTQATFTTETLAIGVRAEGPYPTVQLMSGRVAEAAIWNAVLTDAEVAILAKGYSPLFVRPESLVGYWPLIRAYTDRVGAITLTANNAPVAAAHPRVIYPSLRQVFAPTAAAPTDPEANLIGGKLVNRGLLQGVLVR